MRSRRDRNQSGWPKPPPRAGAAFRSSSLDRTAERKRYDLALGIALAVAAGLSVTFAMAFVDGVPPAGRMLVAWVGLLAGSATVILGGVLLRQRGRTGAAAGLLAAIAAPAAVAGFAAAPFSAAAVIAALSDPAAFTLWAGPRLEGREGSWGVILGSLAALLPASLATRRSGRHWLGLGIAVGAVAMIAVLLVGLAGGFLFRGIRGDAVV